MSQRFFVENSIQSESVSLTGTEAHHLIHVMRSKVGDDVTLFDGGGAEYSASIASIGRAQVELAIGQRLEIDRELPAQVTLGVALPKGDRQRWLVEKATELGVAVLVPLVTTRGVAQPTGKAISRLERAVIESSKQCGRNRLMQVGPPQPFDQFVTESNQQCRLLAHPAGSRQLADCDVASAESIAVAIGPEGGFADDEVASAVSAGWEIVDLGPRILRIETAALAMTSWICLGLQK